MTEKVEAEKLKSNVHETFENLRKALQVREKLLCRQIDVFTTSKKPISDIKFLHDNNEMQLLLNTVRTFGKFNIDYLNIMKNEVYQNENEIDHEHNYKSFNKEENPEKQEVVVSLKANKLKQNLENLELFNESIINFTLNESKDLINLNTLIGSTKSPNDENIDLTNGDKPLSVSGKSKQSKQAKNKDAVHTQTTTPDVVKPKRNACSKGNSCKKDKTLKNISNLTLNGVTGTLNLRNISNLTINSCDSSNNSSSSDDQSPKLTNCDFYKRLITENKLLKNHIRNEWTKTQSYPANNVEFVRQTYSASSSSSAAISPLDSPTEADSKLYEDRLKKIFITKEINIPLQPITIDLNRHSAVASKPSAAHEHTVQVQQWLKQIIYETETEPQPSQELLEFSQIN